MSPAARAIALLVAALVVVTVVAVVAVTRDEPAPRIVQPFRPGLTFPQGGRQGPIAARATIEPRTHLFGDAVTARVLVTFDPKQIRAESIRTNPDFRPYEVLGPPETEREVEDDVGKVVFTYRLRCAVKACAGEDEAQETTFPQGRVDFAVVDVAQRSALAFGWPEVQSVSRVGALDVTNPRWRAEVQTAPAVSYRAAPPVLAAGFFGLTALLGLGGVLLLRAARPERVVEDEEERVEEARLAPLERALGALELAGSNGSDTERRKALELLARELRIAEEPELASRARRLAWSAQRPTAGAADELGRDVRDRTGAA